MTNRDCTASVADTGNILYPNNFFSTENKGIAEDGDDYSPNHESIRLSCEALIHYIKHRLEDRSELPVRLHGLFDELSIMLRQQEEVDVFDLLVELILLADREPARQLSALLAVLDVAAINDLERRTIAETGAFIRDALQGDIVRWYLQLYHEK